MSRFASILPAAALSLLIGAIAGVHAWTCARVPSSARSISTSLCMSQQYPEQQQLRRDFLSASMAAATTAVLFRPEQSFASYIDPATDPPKVTKRVYLDVEFGPKDDEKGRLVIGLYGDLMPKTVANFESLCASNSYAGTSFYRVISDLNIQGGAVGDSTGKTGLSSFEGGKPFEPDNYNLKHTQTGLVSMVRGIGGSVDSRFFVNTKDEAGWADDRYAAFGLVEEGMDLVSKIEKVPVSPPKNAPKSEVKIVASGVLNI